MPPDCGGIGSVVWSLYGYSLAFGGSDDPKSESFCPWIGNGEFLLMHNVQPSWDETGHKAVVHFYDDAEKGAHGDLVDDGRSTSPSMKAVDPADYGVAPPADPDEPPKPDEPGDDGGKRKKRRNRKTLF